MYISVFIFIRTYVRICVFFLMYICVCISMYVNVSISVYSVQFFDMLFLKDEIIVISK